MSAPTMSDAEWAAMTDRQWLERRIARCAAEGWAANQERYERVLKVITDAEATSTALREMREALEEIARQELSADMSVDAQLDGDFEGAYDHMIERARAAIEKATKP